MVTAFLITTLVYFSLTLILNILTLGVNVGKNGQILASAVGVVVSLLMLTFNIFALVSQL